jgi:hypothetical protein
MARAMKGPARGFAMAALNCYAFEHLSRVRQGTHVSPPGASPAATSLAEASRRG